jgi:hypothetical protein
MKTKTIKPAILLLIILLLAVASSCNKTAEDTNKPVIIQGFNFTVDNVAVTPAGTLQIKPGQVLTIKVNYTDPDAGANPDPSKYTYHWTVELVDSGSASLDPNSNFVAKDQNPSIWTAPNITGFYKFRVQVLDRYNAPSVETIVVEVNSNEKPVITSMDVSKTDPFINEVVTVTVVASDPDSNLPLEYVWQATGGYFTTENDGVAKWLSPAPGAFQITVNVSDQAGGTTSRTVPINVQANHPPVVEGWEVDPNESVAVNGLVTITITATDIDGDVLEYNWSSDKGNFSNVSNNVATWRAPSVAGTATVTCVVEDNKGGSDTANIVINVI